MPKKAPIRRGKPTKNALKDSLPPMEKNKGLAAFFPGKRLDQAMEEQPEETVRTLSRNFAMIPVEKISANPDQPRKDFEEEPLEELAASIRVHGIIQPLTVRHMGDGTYQIISGERRFRASQRAELKEVPAFIRTANDQSLLEMALIENIQRQDLNPMEVAYSYYRLKEDFSLTHEEVADRVGKPRSTVSNYLGILQTSPRVQKAIRERQISIGVAKTFAGIKDIGQQEAFLDDILQHKNWNARDIEREARAYKKKNVAGKSRQASDDDTKRVERAFQEFFELKAIKVKLEKKGSRSGSITISFSNKEELDQLFKAVE